MFQRSHGLRNFQARIEGCYDMQHFPFDEFVTREKLQKNNFEKLRRLVQWYKNYCIVSRRSLWYSRFG